MKKGHAALIFLWIILFPSYIQPSQHRGTGTCGTGVLHSDAAERVRLDGGRQVHFAHNVGIVRIWKGQHILYLSSQGVARKTLILMSSVRRSNIAMSAEFAFTLPLTPW